MRFSFASFLCLALISSGCAASQEAAPQRSVATSAETSRAEETAKESLHNEQAEAKPTEAASSAATSFTAPSFEIARRLPTAQKAAGLSASARGEIATIKSKLAKFPTFSNWHRLAEIYESAGMYADAAKALRAEAAMYRAKGLADAAQIRDGEAAQLSTDVRLFRMRTATPGETKSLYSRAPLEPILGCYIGAFIDRDDALTEKYFDENWQEHRSSPQFERLAGKHASYFMYVRYGQKFPKKWAETLKRQGAIPHIAWEPKSLKDVRDDSYLKSWGAAIRALDWPVFIRFAGEMNGDWTPYHGNPALYRQKFALVHNTLHRAAPRVATIWCVNSVPLGNIESYYPGDANCDWVGINVYSVPFFDNDPKRPAFAISPQTLIDPIYKKYAARKPIAICEFAASFQSRVDNKPRIDLAQNKMAQLYSALPLLYPRVKMINWFSMDTVRHARPGRKLNNYRLTQHREILNLYRSLAATNHFRKERERLAEAQPEIARPLGSKETFEGSAKLVLWVQTYLARPKVYARLNNQIIYAQNRPGAHNLNLDLTNLKGNQKLEIFIYDNQNKLVSTKLVSFVSQ